MLRYRENKSPYTMATTKDIRNWGTQRTWAGEEDQSGKVAWNQLTN